MAPRIVLLGAPGSGKTTVGSLVAEELGWEFDATDALVARTVGKPVADILVDEGDAAFRHYENQALAELLANATGVLEVGGGAVLTAENEHALQGRPNVWLRVQLDNAVRRTGLNVARPAMLGTVRSQLRSHLARRDPVYSRLALVTIDTDHRSPESLASEICRDYRRAVTEKGPTA